MRDVSKVLTDAEALKLRALLAQTPDIQIDSALGQEYPKMLFHPNYIELYRLVKDHPDPLVKKEAQQKMSRVIVIVHDIETEEDYLQDKWRSDPNDFIVMSKEEGGLGEADPRIPVGREGRRASALRKQDRETELRDLRRRYAELTGRSLIDVEPPAAEPVAAAPPPRPKLNGASASTSAARSAQPTVSSGGKRDRVKAATARSTGAHV